MSTMITMLKRLTTGMLLSITLTGCTLTNNGETAMTSPVTASVREDDRQSVLDISRQKWLWMADRNTGELGTLFHPSARFVHMGATMDRQAELDVIQGGQIEYRHADISEMSVELVGDTAIVYSRLRLLAVVGGNEVTNPFSVTETYVRVGGRWQLCAMAFTRLLGE